MKQANGCGSLLNEVMQSSRPVFLLMGLFSFFMNLLLMVLPIYSLQVFDRVLSTASMDTLFWLSAIVVVVFFVASVLQMLRSFVLIKVGEWMDEKLSATLLKNSLACAAITGMRSTQNLRDLNTVRGFLTGNGLLTFFDAPWSVIALAILYGIHKDLGNLTLACSGVLLLLAWINEVAMRQPLDDANRINTKNFYQLDIAMRNAEVIAAMGMGQAVANFWKKANRHMMDLQSLASYRSSFIQAVTRFLRLSLQIAITGWGAFLAIHNEISSGSIIAASILAGRALQPFDAAIGVWKSLVEARESYASLRKSLANMPVQAEGINLPQPVGRIDVEKIVYGTPNRDQPIIRGISFNLNPGETLGIIGPSAAGKSTLAKLIVGVWKPQSGCVRLDGGEIQLWNREQIGRATGYLPQDVELFGGTVQDNIARLDTNASDEAIIKAAQMAFAHNLIMSLPKGYATDIGPNGINLSAGQRQRIGLARAFYGNPRLLILDEPDASLDLDGEQALTQAIVGAKAQKVTSIVITHKRSLLSYMDKLLVIKDGEIMLYGPAQQVMMAMAPGEYRVANQPSAQMAAAMAASRNDGKGSRYAVN